MMLQHVLIHYVLNSLIGVNSEMEKKMICAIKIIIYYTKYILNNIYYIAYPWVLISVNNRMDRTIARFLIVCRDRIFKNISK